MTVRNATPARTGQVPRRIVAALTGLAVLSAGLLITPLPRGFQGERTGDPVLSAEVSDLLGSAHWQHIAIARVDGEKVTWAGVGADENTEFEIGSITKTFTAALFADAVERGEVTADTHLGEVWPSLTGPVAEVTLASIAAQSSGLPAQVPAPDLVTGFRSFIGAYLHTDQHLASAAEVVASLRTVTLSTPEPLYSNYGFAVLGLALSEVSGKPYPELVRERITEPLGMKDTMIPASAKDLSHGYTASGLPAAPWTMAGSASAGAIRSTAHDLSIWLRATRDGTAPGAAAAIPRTDFDDVDRIGWAWFTRTAGATGSGSTEGKGTEVTWHNGGTGGYRSVLGFTRGAHEGAGIIVLVDSATDVDAALRLLIEPASQEGATR